jgi:hypothetical protein
MPNHVTTIMRVKSRTKEVFDFIKSPDTKPEDERREIDFDTLIPMPARATHHKRWLCHADQKPILESIF